jgi:hypothetical protein
VADGREPLLKRLFGAAADALEAVADELRYPLTASQTGAGDTQRADADERGAAPAPVPPEARSDATSARAEAVMGLAVAEMLCWGADWVHRRTETFSFSSDRTVRRQMAVDFQLPRGAQRENLNVRAVELMAAFPGPTLVPLTTLRKQALTDFDLFDEERRSLPLLTTEQNGEVAGEALVALARAAARRVGFGRKFPQSVDLALRQVALLPATPAAVLLDSLLEGADRHRQAAERVRAEMQDGEEGLRRRQSQEFWARYEALVGLQTAPDDALDKTKRMMRAEPLRALARKLASEFIVVIELDGERAFERRIIKLAYEEPVAFPRHEQQERRWRRAGRRAAERMCWTPKQFDFSQIAAGDSEGHHIELVAPDGLDIVGASFAAWYPRRTPAPDGNAASSGQPDETRPSDTPSRANAGEPQPRPAETGAAPQRAGTGKRSAASQPTPEVLEALGTAAEHVRPTGRHVIGDDNPRRGHLHLRDLPPQTYATARVKLRVDPSGLLNAAVLVALLITGILFWGQERWDNIQQEDAAAAILLAVPTLVAAYLARPGEHQLVSLLLTGVRFCVALSGALMFVAAASVAFGYRKTGQLGDIWCVVKWASVAPLGVLALSSLAVRWPSQFARGARALGAPLRWGRLSLEWVLRRERRRQKTADSSDTQGKVVSK